MKRDAHAIAAAAIGLVVGLSTLGIAGLVDPWETHYAEVAREMLERGDWVSPWWANEGWFTSKPILAFWLEAASMWLFRVHVGPDQVLGSHPEWAVRFPTFAFLFLGSMLLYFGVAQAKSKRAALIGVGILWTMPGFALLSHQALTDGPMVGCVAGALGLVLLALSTKDTAETKYGWVLAAGIALAILPQLLIVLFSATLKTGSPNACGLPSQPACAAMALAHPRLTPILQCAFWLAPAAFVVDAAFREKRLAKLYAIAAWMLAAIGAMAKGPVALVIPAAAILVFAVARRSIRPILRFEIVVGVVLAFVLIGPWYLAVYARHGRWFIDQVVTHHMFGRALEHLHDTNELEDVGFVYFLKQLAYATFPWSGIALVGTFGFRRGLARTVLAGAALATFLLVSLMQTKFHHYVLPAVPPVAMITGIAIDEILERRVFSPIAIGAAAVFTVLVGRDLTKTPTAFIQLLSYKYSRVWPSTRSFALFFTIIAASFAAGVVLTRIQRWVGLAVMGGAALACAIALVAVYLPRCARDGGQRDLLATYYQEHPSGPLVAYQLNWKGENFYTGNDVAIFITSGAPLKAWLATRHDQALYFLTEKGRVPVLKAEIQPKDFTELRSNAEYSLVRATL